MAQSIPIAGSITPESAERFKERKAILEVMKTNKLLGESLARKAYQDEQISLTDLRTLVKTDTAMDYLSYKIKKIQNPQDAIDVLRVAMPEEKSKIKEIVLAKIVRSQSVLPKQREELLRQYREIVGAKVKP